MFCYSLCCLQYPLNWTYVSFRLEWHLIWQNSLWSPLYRALLVNWKAPSNFFCFTASSSSQWSLCTLYSTIHILDALSSIINCCCSTLKIFVFCLLFSASHTWIQFQCFAGVLVIWFHHGFPHGTRCMWNKADKSSSHVSVHHFKHTFSKLLILHM